MIFLDAKKALCRKLDMDYSTIFQNDVFSDADLADWLNQGALKAWDYKPWDMAEGDKTTTLAGADITAGYIDYPTQFISGQGFSMFINGKRYYRKTFSDYVAWKTANPTSTDRYYAERKRFLFVNFNGLSAGATIDFYGKNRFTKMTGDNDLLPFSPDTDAQEDSGNQAIVLLAYSEALGSEKKKDEQRSVIQQNKGYAMLDKVWEGAADSRSNEQSKDNPMFAVPNFFPRNSGRNSSLPGTFSQS